jgi:hypothetical protein
MKSISFLLVLFFSLAISARDTQVQGYTRSDGTYVAPHMRSAPDSTRANNYGPSTPSSSGLYDRDQDNDKLYNQYDSDDDNDGIHDDFEGKELNW